METYIYIISLILLLSISSIVAFFVLNKSGQTNPEPNTETNTDTDIQPIPKTNTPQTYTVSGCEGESKPLVCPSGKVASGEIKYGRWDNSICQHPTVNNSTTSVFKTYPVTPEMSSMSGIDTVKDDPYPNVFKHYTVNYTCS